MKKILTLASLIVFTNFVFAGGDENEIKNFRFGLKIDPSINWYKPDGKLISKNGSSMKFGGGLILEFRLAKVASIQTGLNITTGGGKVKYNNGGYYTPNANNVSYYYNNSDEKIEPYGTGPSGDSTSYYTFYTKYTHYQLNERVYKSTYITIPLLLKLKTKEIGMMTYYGQFGVNNYFRWSVKADDKVTVLNPINYGATDTKSKVDVTKDAEFYTAALNFGAGTEINLSGTTSVVIGLSYNLGFLNSVKSQSDYLEKRSNDAIGIGTFSQLPQTLKSNSIVLSLGVLF